MSGMSGEQAALIAITERWIVAGWQRGNAEATPRRCKLATV